MSTILSIETSSINCSVAISRDVELLACIEKKEANIHASSVTLFIDNVIKSAGLNFDDIDAIAVGKGPGSYTGLRIGVSTAKGLCYALEKPLIACNSLYTMYSEAISKAFHSDYLYCPLIDARRMEVYTCFFDSNGRTINNISAKIIDDKSFESELKESKILFFGDGAEKIKSIYKNNSNAYFLDDLYPSSRYMINEAHQLFEQNKFEDVAYFEPYYLKEFYFNK